MLHKLLGTKIGMTQLFDENRRVVPVTVIDMGGWFVTQIKTTERDGYAALQLGQLRKRYRGKAFENAWLRAKKKFFLHCNEVLLDADTTDYHLGQAIELKDCGFGDKDKVAVAGTSRGLGFQGTVKRWGFAGGPKSHGSRFHRAPGSIGNMCSQGEVVKGKKLPGQMGARRITVKGLRVVKFDQDSNCLFVRGAVPGKKNSLLFISKQVV